MSQRYIIDSSCSIATAFQLNYLLLHLWFRKFVGRLDIPQSKQDFECEMLGTPVLERVFVEPYSNLSVDRNTFWIGKNNPNKERFLLTVREDNYLRTAYVKAFVSSRLELLIDNYFGSEILSIERELSDRFQSFLRSFLEVDCY